MNKKQIFEGIDNKEIIAFAAILIVIIILLLFEFLVFRGRPEVVEERAQYEEKLQSMTEVTVEVEQKTVYKALNDIIQMMNKKDYEGLYNALKDDYRNYYFSDYNSFKEFIDKYARYEYYSKYSSYYRDGNLYYIMVDFMQSKYTREDLLNPMAQKVDTIVLEEQNNGDFKFAMNGFAENIAHNNSKTVDGVTFSLVNSIRNTETMKTNVLVRNDSNKKVIVNTTNLQPDVIGGVVAKVSTSDSITVEPGGIGMLSVEYYFKFDSGMKFNGITVRGAKFADGTIIEDVYISK